MPKILGAILAFTLFFAISTGMLIGMLKLWVAGQAKIGNANIGMVKYVNEHFWRVILIVCGVWIAGLLIALPFMIKDGFFNQ